MNANYIRDEMADAEQAAIERYLDASDIRLRLKQIGIGLAFLGLVLLLCVTPKLVHAQTVAPVVTFDASVKSAVAPISTVLTWSSTGALTCTASGAGSGPGWSGSVPLSGTRTLTGINVNMTPTLACTGPAGTDTVVLSWTTPTKNEDGTALTDLAGFTLYRGDTTTLTPLPGDLAPTLTTISLPSQPAGALFYAIDAWANRGVPVTKVRSVLSNVVSRTVVTGPAQTTTKSIAITVIPKPGAPVLTVADPTAYEIYPSGANLVVHRIGVVRPLALCASEGQQVVAGVTYSRIDSALVDRDVAATGPDKWVAVPYAKCTAA